MVKGDPFHPFLYALDEVAVKQIEAELEAVLRPYVAQAAHKGLRQQAYVI